MARTQSAPAAAAGHGIVPARPPLAPARRGSGAVCASGSS